MTASTVWINGQRLGEYKGGYTPFSFDLTPHLDFDGENVLAVDLDSSERPDIPPFGYQIDYLTFGGIYREVSLRIVPATFIENVFAKPKEVLTDHPSLDVDCYIQRMEASRDALTLEVSLRDGDRVLAKGTQKIPAAQAEAEPAAYTVHLEKLGAIKLWDLTHPNLYNVQVRLLRGTQAVDEVSRTIGFREAQFTDHGFELNGKVIKLRGLDRHQTFPFVGQAMPGRAQRRDAHILRHKLKCNIVRTSHYPQSRHFLDACDEIGLLVLEEIPGWQHIGDEPWKLISIDNVGRMIRRDWNHPSIILWGVRINESKDDHDFYVRTNALAHKLDPTRQTGGIRYFQESEFLEDVFTMNDFGFPLKPPNHSALPEHRIRRAHLSHQDHRPGGAPHRTHAAPRPHPRPAGFERRNTPAASAGAPSTTTRTAILAPAIASAITASPTFSANPSRRPVSTNRNAIPRKRSCSSRPSTGRGAMPRSASRTQSCAPTATT